MLRASVSQHICSCCCKFCTIFRLLKTREPSLRHLKRVYIDMCLRNHSLNNKRFLMSINFTGDIRRQFLLQIGVKSLQRTHLISTSQSHIKTTQEQALQCENISVIHYLKFTMNFYQRK